MRLFVAIDLEPSVLAGVAGAVSRLRGRAPRAKWVDPANLHVTLLFLGERPEEQLPAFERQVREAAAQHPPPQLSVRSGGSFGPRAHPRVLWVGLEGSLAALHAELERRFEPLGVEREHRPFAPHLTLARARDLKGDPKLAHLAERLRESDFGTSIARELVLYRSQLTPMGSIYTPLVRAPFEGAVQRRRPAGAPA